MLQNVKTEGRQTKLLAAIAVFAMVVCALAVVLPSESDADNSTSFDYGTDDSGKNVNDTGVDVATGSDGWKYVFANGVPVVIEENESGVTEISTATGTYITDSDSNTVVVGGSLSVDVTSSSITINSGVVKNLIGGGLYDADVTNASVTVNGGSINRVSGGGYAGSDSAVYKGDSSTEDGVKAWNYTANATVTINGGSISVAVAGGIFGYTYVGTTVVDVNGGSIGELIAGGINGITENSTITVDNAVIANGGYSYEGETGYGLISAGNRGENKVVSITINSLAEGSKALVTPGALSDATGTDGGTNVVLRQVTLNVTSDVDAVFLLGITQNKNTNPWDTGTTSPTMEAAITFNAPAETLIFQDLNSSATESYSKVYNLTGGITLSTDSSIFIPIGMTLNGKVTANGSSVEFENLTGGTEGTTIQGGSIIISGTIDASQNVSFTASGEVTIGGDVIGSTDNTGTLTIVEVADGNNSITIEDLTISNGGSLTIPNGTTVNLAGTITVEGETSAGSNDAGSLYIAGQVNGQDNAAIVGAYETAADAIIVSVDTEKATETVDASSYDAFQGGEVKSGVGETGTWELDGTNLILTNYTGSLYFYGADGYEFDTVTLNGVNKITINAAAVDSFVSTGQYFGAIRSNSITVNEGADGGSLTIEISGALALTKNMYIAGITANSVTINADVTVINNMTKATGDASSYTITKYGIKGGVNRTGNVTVGSDVTINGDVSASTLTMTDATINGNTDASTFDFYGNVNIDSIEGSFTIKADATVIVDDVVINSGEIITNNGGALIIMNSLSYTSTSGNIMVYNGVAQQVLPNNIYLASGATFTGNVTPVPVENAVTGTIVNNIDDANYEIRENGNDVTIVSIDPVDISGLVGADGVTVTVGTVYGTNNNLVGTIVSDNLGYVDDEDNVVSATINGVAFNDVSGTGMSVTGTTVQTDDGYQVAITVEGSEITGPVVGGGIAVEMSNISSGADGITFMAGSVIVSGTIQFDGQTVTERDNPSTIVFSGADVSSDATDDGLVFEDLEVTGRGTVMVDRLTIRGDVTIGTNVTLLVASGSEIIVERDAVLGGTGTVEVLSGGSITVNGTIESTVNVETTNSTIVYSAEEFVSALPYYTTIELGANMEFFGDDWDGQTVTVQGKTINMGTYGIYVGSVDADDNVTSAMTLEFVNTTVNGESGTFEVRDGSVLGIDGADIYANVIVYDDATLELANNVTDITGASTELRSVGFGKVINFSNNYNMASGTQLKVYGTINVNEGYTLTVDSNAGIQIMSSGSMTVDGTLVVGGTLQVAQSESANMVVNGTMTITGTIGGTVSNYGTIDFDGKSGDSANGISAASIDMYDGATLNVESVSGTMTVEGETDYVKSNNDRELAPELDRGIVTLTDVEGVTITASQTLTAAVVTGTDLRGAQISVALDVSGAVTAGVITVDREFTYDANDTDVDTPEYAPVTFTETVSLAEDTIIVFSADNEYLVSGIINAADGATITNNGEVTVAGTVTITVGTARDISNAHIAFAGSSSGWKVNAVYYDVTTAASGSTPASITRTYTSLATAIDAADGADNKTVYVVGDVEVDEGVTVTVPADIDVNGNNGNIDVMGTLTFENFRESYAPYSNPNIAADVRIDADPARTYTSLANAIEMGMTDITLNRVAHITEDLTIPAGTTVRGGDGTGVYVEAAYDGATGDVTLTVEGALILYSSNSTGKFIETYSNDERYDASVVVAGEDGYIYVPQSSDNTDIQNVAGAHYLRSYEYNRATYSVYVVSTVMHAAADSENVAADNAGDYVITIKGEITVDSVEFTAPEGASDDNPLIVGVVDISTDSQSSLRFSQIIIGSAVVLGSQNAELTGTVVMLDADGNSVSEVDLSRVLGAMVGVYAYVDDDTGEESDRMGIVTDGFLTGGTVTVSVGTVYTSSFKVQNGTYTVGTDAVRYNGVLAIANGATLVVSGGTDADVALNIDGTGTNGTGNNVAMTVDGTLVIEGTADVDGATIDGTVTVQNDGKLRIEDNVAVNGTIDVITTDQYEDSELIVKGVLTVGAKPTELGVTAGAGTVNGAVTIQDNGYIRAYPGADLSGAQINVVADVSEMESMSFVINGETYMTVYVDEADDTLVATILDGEEFDLLGLDVGLNYGMNAGSQGQSVNTGLYQIGNWYSNESMAGNTVLSGEPDGTDGTKVVDFDTVYAHAEPASVTGTFSVGTGITMYVDDVPVTSGNSATLTVGTHTVRYDIQAGYNGDNVVISFNGQTIQNNGTITIDVTDTTFNLTASGAVPASSGSGDITVNVPSQDDGMSLTDILLIVLVILIVIMAIIVALRLMRS